MGCSCSSKCVENLLMFLAAFVLPLGLLVVTTIASMVSFSPSCMMRVDLLAILHAGSLMLIGLVVLIMRAMRGTYFDSVSAEHALGRFVKMTAILPIPVLVLMIVIVSKRDHICYFGSTNFSIVWFLIFPGIFGLGSAIVGVMHLCGILNRRWRLRRRRLRLRAEANKQVALISHKLQALRHKREGWEILCGELWPKYLNLQDYQKESLLPIFVLYAMD